MKHEASVLRPGDRLGKASARHKVLLYLGILCTWLEIYFDAKSLSTVIQGNAPELLNWQLLVIVTLGIGTLPIESVHVCTYCQFFQLAGL